ncbi:MAG: acetolactate synthase, partial [Nitrososphaerota archaeon]|nr:acetolactate synthase [Nitrososphaerota archaeon]
MLTNRKPSENGTIDVENVAQAILFLAGKMGLEYLFLTGGTDLAPIQDALTRFEVDKSVKTNLTPVNVPHETVSTAMAMGYAMYTGKPAGVAVHVHVGTSNSLGNLMNARRSRVPMLLLAGRTPKTEIGHPGSRDYW